jgi:hypothetical protein
VEPENRAETGGRDQAGRYLPGQSGNPGGRPKSAVISEALREKLAQEVNGQTRAELVAEKAIVLAQEGSVRSLKLIADRTEGRVPQTINLGRAGGMRKSFVVMRSSVYHAMTEEEKRSAFSGIKVYLTGEDGKNMFDAWDDAFPEWRAAHPRPEQPHIVVVDTRIPNPLFEPEDTESSSLQGMQQVETTGDKRIPGAEVGHCLPPGPASPAIPTEFPRSLSAEDKFSLVRAAADPEPEEPSPFLRAHVPPGMHAEDVEVEGIHMKRYVANPPAEKPASLWEW